MEISLQQTSIPIQHLTKKAEGSVLKKAHVIQLPTSTNADGTHRYNHSLNDLCPFISVTLFSRPNYEGISFSNFLKEKMFKKKKKRKITVNRNVVIGK